MLLYMRPDITKAKFAHFDGFMKLTGKMYREMDNRRTFSFYWEEKEYFLKLHFGVGWQEILKNITQLKSPILGAQNEWLALEKLHSLHVPTIDIVAYGKKGINPATMNSFIMTDALKDVESLEFFCPRYFREVSVDDPLKKAIICKIAWIAKLMHQNGLVHRDLYICHFWLDLSVENLTPENLKLYIIDLHRALLFSHVPRRWIIKDLAAIYFSAMDLPLVAEDLDLFIEEYSKDSPNKLVKKKKFWQQVAHRATKLYRKIFKKNPAVFK